MAQWGHTWWHGNSFHVTGPLWGESAAQGWIPLTLKEPVMQNFEFLSAVSLTNCWTNSWVAMMSMWDVIVILPDETKSLYLNKWLVTNHLRNKSGRHFDIYISEQNHKIELWMMFFNQNVPHFPGRVYEMLQFNDYFHHTSLMQKRSITRWCNTIIRLPIWLPIYNTLIFPPPL